MMEEDGIELSGERMSYEPLNTGTATTNVNYRCSPDFNNISPEHSTMEALPPRDTKNTVYLSLLTAGISFVLPYNAFVIASDYWSERFPSRSVELDISSTYVGQFYKYKHKIISMKI